MQENEAVVVPHETNIPLVHADDLDPLHMVFIPQQQLGIWASGSSPGFLYQDFNGLVWQIDAGSICHLRDAARATGKPGIHWNNSTPPKDFAFDKAQEAAYNKKTRWTGVNSSGMIQPVAVPGSDINIVLPENAAMLDATQSHDPNGGTLSYQWLLNNATDPLRVKIDNPSSPITAVTFAQAGTYAFDLKVTNRAGLSDVKQVRVSVLPAKAPIVFRVNEPGQPIAPDSSNIVLDASSLFMPGVAAIYMWEQLSGPVMPVIVSQDKPVAQVGGLISGQYEFQFSATKQGDKTATNVGHVKITVTNQVQPAQQQAQQGETPAGSVPATQNERPVQSLAGMPQIPTVTSPMLPYVHRIFEKDMSKEVFRPKKRDHSTEWILAGILTFGVLYLLSKRRRQV